MKTPDTQEKQSHIYDTVDKQRRRLTQTAWLTPVIAAVTLPAHAQTSPTTTTTTTVAPVVFTATCALRDGETPFIPDGSEIFQFTVVTADFVITPEPTATDVVEVLEVLFRGTTTIPPNEGVAGDIAIHSATVGEDAGSIGTTESLALLVNGVELVSCSWVVIA